MKQSLCFVAALVLLVVCSCCGKRYVEPQFCIIEADTLLPCGAINCDVKYSFASILNADSDPSLKAIKESNIQHFFELEGFCGSADEAVVEAMRVIQDDASENITCQIDGGRKPWINCEFVKSEAVVVDTLLVYTILRETYSGGAHGMNSFMAHNYSLRGGYELALGDIFSPEQQMVLSAMIRRKLYEKFGVVDDKGLAEKGLFPEYIGTTENFVVHPQGITFHYNPYEIACYAVGRVELTFSREELDLL